VFDRSVEEGHCLLSLGAAWYNIFEGEEIAMKKILSIMMTVMFVLALGAAYAEENGVTDFTGRSYDNFEIQSGDGMKSVEGMSAGGLRSGERDLYNGVTDFSGRSYDTFEIGAAGTGAMKSREQESGGGLRGADRELYNGVTDFSGRSYE
jgi:hypothetical protein